MLTPSASSALNALFHSSQNQLVSSLRVIASNQNKLSSIVIGVEKSLQTKLCHINWYTAISIKVIPEQSGKVEYERERLLGIAMNNCHPTWITVCHG
jgi:hypothetical protein